MDHARRGRVRRVAGAAVLLLTVASGCGAADPVAPREVLSEETGPGESRSGGITREQAEASGVAAAPGDALIVSMKVSAGGGTALVEVRNVSATADTYTVVVLVDEAEVGSAEAAIGAGEEAWVEVATDLDLAAVAATVRVDGALLGEGVAERDLHAG